MMIMHIYAFILLSVILTPAAAFVPSHQPSSLATQQRTKSSAFFMAVSEQEESASTITTSRRDVLKQSLAAALTPVAFVAAAAAVPMSSSAAEIDFAKVQDLLGSSAITNPEAYSSTKRPMYLTEPTDEFKANEIKSSEFKRAQVVRKKQFQTILDKLQTDPNDADMLEADLDNLRKLVTAGEGLPLGITKQDVINQVRRRKATKYWPTKVEIAYQDLVSEINYQQSPNTEKNAENPF